ncbi:unnamed protein product [Spirodela intermedia]|uniref:Protein kinase domain-containing protein n=1 Tax=Spirodela intermedia TaxID=51605 RepID=A0A7I8JRE0_SPIIN|nr:unnamed protein product [Spirodela intermedia]CAA6672704.1 unnamed protein product [Spirodela intermedia]
MAAARCALSLALILCYFASGAVSEPTRDKAALLAFLNQTPHESRIQWNSSSSACDWRGISCNANRTQISGLRVISLRANRLSGPIPADFGNLTALRALYVQGNVFSGELPAGMARLAGLVRLDLSGNNLTGEVPSFLNELRNLTGLFLQGNSFSGELPTIDLPGLTGFNVSNNKLNGSIPAALGRFPPSSFAGNLGLCGVPLPPCSPASPAPAPAPQATGEGGESRPKKKKEISKAAIIAIAVVCGSLLLLMLLLLLLLVLRVFRRRRRQSAAKTLRGGGGGEGASSSKEEEVGGRPAGEERNKLVVLEKGIYSFDLEDLLRASAEVLGKGSAGTSYKAVLEDGTTVVRDFEAHMEALGRVNHDHVVPFRAFYFSKDEKLLLSDYLPAGSLSSLLHGSRGAPLDWDNRLRIALAAGQGLAHLHSAVKLVHGNVKASNVLLLPDPLVAAVSDFGLSSLLGFSAPEPLRRLPRAGSGGNVEAHLQVRPAHRQGPQQCAGGEEATDLPRWVQSMVREEWTGEVFDAELVRYGNTEEEMVQVLQIALACVAIVPDARPAMEEVVRMLQDVVRSKGSFSGGPTPPAAATREGRWRIGSSSFST